MTGLIDLSIVYSLVKIGAALLLVVINGLFVAAEFAFVKVRPTRLDQLIAEGNILAKHARNCVEHLDAYLSVSQLGITLASLGLGWLGEPAIASILHPLLGGIAGLSDIAIHSISFLVGFGIITLLHVVFGELAPKTLAIERAEAVALILALPMRGFYYIFYPAVVVLNGTANAVVRMIGLHPAGAHENVHSGQELQMIIEASYDGGGINQSEQELLQNVFRFEQETVDDVMVPRTELVFLDKEDSSEANMALINRHKHTRYPYCDGSPDNVIGMIHVRDIFLSETMTPDFDSIRRDVIYVPEGQPLGKILAEFRKQRQHMAIVIDEYGGTSGAIFIDNVLEELVGDIFDEFDDEDAGIQHFEDGSSLVRGQISLVEAIDVFELPIKIENTQCNTLAGYVISELDTLPTEGDSILVGKYQVNVVSVDNKRIEWIRMIPMDLCDASQVD